MDSEATHLILRSAKIQERSIALMLWGRELSERLKLLFERSEMV